jgi:hypothetical protein
LWAFLTYDSAARSLKVSGWKFAANIEISFEPELMVEWFELPARVPPMAMSAGYL